MAGFFAEQLRRKFGLQQLTLSPKASEWLKAYRWPGNVRELEHVLSRAALLAKSNTNQGITRIEPMHLTGLVDAFSVPKESLKEQPNKIGLDTAEIQDLKQATEDFQRQTIQQALDQAGLNWAQAARSLAMDRANLVRLAKRLGIEVTKQRNS